MKRILAFRLIALELAPIVAALAVSAYSQRLMPPAFLAASIVILLSVTLSIRDGAVLAKYGCVFERRENRGWFWFWVSAHISLAAFCLFAAAIVFLWPSGV